MLQNIVKYKEAKNKIKHVLETLKRELWQISWEVVQGLTAAALTFECQAEEPDLHSARTGRS